MDPPFWICSRGGVRRAVGGGGGGGGGGIHNAGFIKLGSSPDREQYTRD